MAGITTARGYGWDHQKLRAQLIATYHPTEPCWRCGYALGPVPELLDLGHVDGDKTRYAGLEHRWCNRRRRRTPSTPSTPPTTTITTFAGVVGATF